HVAVFDRVALVESLAQVGVFLELWHADGEAGARGAAISFITGPSPAADIELTLTRGVHGAKEVHAIFVEHALGGWPLRHARLRDGREVNLCGKYGARESRHWHGLDEGYTARQPL